MPDEQKITAEIEKDKPRFGRVIKLLIILGILILINVLLVGGYILDLSLSRPDRIAFAKQKNDLISVYDAILRYEHENKTLPDNLDDLKLGYLRPDQLVGKNGQQLYRFDRKNRLISLASPTRITGLYSRTVGPATMSLPETQDPLSHVTKPEPDIMGKFIVPKGLPGVAPPEGALVFEGEHYSEMNYGWEAHQDPSCSGGAYMYSKEGMGNGPGQWGGKIFNFYDIREGKEYTFIRYHFYLPKDGKYYIYGRIWTTGSHCSNCIITGIDQGGPRPYPVGKERYHGSPMRNKTPFRWVWTPAKEPVTLKAGEHFLQAFLHEDGVRVDQFMLSPVQISGDQIYKPNLEVNKKTGFLTQKTPILDTTFDLKSMVITENMPPKCNLVIRKRQSAKGRCMIRIILENAEKNSTDLPLGEFPLKLSDLPDLLFLPIPFDKLDLSSLPRREYLLKAEVIYQGKIISKCNVPLMHPFKWKVCGPFGYFRNHRKGPLDGDKEPSKTDKLQWAPLKDSSWDHFGVIDFGMQAIGNSLHAPEKVTSYAKTGIHVPETDTYLLKIQSDDQMILWIDGKIIYRHDKEGPVTRSVKRLLTTLEKGNHQVRIRVNQRGFSYYGDGRWQASLRFRTKDDELSNITGIDPK